MIFLRTIIFCLLFLCTIYTSLKANNVKGLIKNDTTWSDTITVTEDVIISNKSTLNISAGTLVIMKTGVNIFIKDSSHFQAIGNVSAKIYIKCENDLNIWGSISSIGANTSIILKYVDVQAGQIRGEDSASIDVSNCFFHDYLSGSNVILYTNKALFFHMNACHISNYFEQNYYNTLSLIEEALI